MDRRRYPQQQYVPPGMVDFGQMDFGHDVVAQQMPGILQNYQQRWDMQDAAIAKLLEEQAGTQMLEGDAQAVGNLLKSSFDEIDTLVKDKYQGDRGAAAMDIVKRLSAARAPLAQAKAEKEKYDKAFAEYQNAAQRGQAPKTFVPGEGFKTLDFDTYHELQGQQAFGEKGYTPRSYNPLRGASDLSGYLDKGISKKLSSRVWQDILKENEKTPGYLEQITRKGYTGEQLEKYFDPKNFDQDAFVKELIGEVPHLAQEFENASPEELFDYAKGIIKSQVSEQLMKDYKSDGTGKERGGAPTRDELMQRIFSGETTLRASRNPVVEAAGSYSAALNPSRMNQFGRMFINEKDPIKFKDGVNSLDGAINTIQQYLIDSKSTGDTDTRRRAQNQLDRYYEIKEDFDIARNNIKNNVAQSLFKVNYDELGSEEERQKVDVDSRVPKSDKDLAAIMDTDDKLITYSMGIGKTILHPVTKKIANETLISQMEDWSFSSSVGKSASSHIDDVLKKDLGISNPQFVKDYITKSNIGWTYDRSRGEYFINVPKDWKKNGNPESDTKYERLYFAPGDVGEASRTVLNTLTRSITNRNKTNSQIVSDGVRFTFQYQANKNTKPSDKTQEKIEMTDMWTGQTKLVSLDEVQRRMEQMQTEYLIDTYTLPHMSLVDQAKPFEFTDN